MVVVVVAVAVVAAAVVQRACMAIARPHLFTTAKEAGAGTEARTAAIHARATSSTDSVSPTIITSTTVHTTIPITLHTTITIPITIPRTVRLFPRPILRSCQVTHPLLW